jgi:hypothetical protein
MSIQPNNNLGAPVLTEINNGVLKGIKSMPMKDINSDNQNSFSLWRNMYYNNVFLNTYTTSPSAFRQTTNVGISHTYKNTVVKRYYPPNTTFNQIQTQKKWIGGNRDASFVTTKNRVNEIGVGSFNANSKQFTFKNVDDNTARQARARARSGGSVAPLKKTHKYKNPPVFPI